MKSTLLTPVIFLALGACAADGTSLNGPTTAATAAPVTSPAAATVATTPTTAAASTIATTPVETVPVATAVPATNIGQIVLVEPVAPVSQRGGNALLSIGSSVVGALIPGPWGSVAGVAAGQVGNLAITNADTASARYHVRMANGTIETITQSGGISLPVGTSVQILTLGDGSRALVQTGTPAAVTAPI